MSASRSREQTPHILALVTDAFGSTGGIALYMRDVLRCVAGMEEKPRITLLARTGEVAGSELPENIDWESRALGSKWRYVLSVMRVLLLGSQPHLVLCGHVNLMPLARLAALRARAPLVLFIYGIDAWGPPRSRLAARVARSATCVVSISEITRQRFLSWSASNAMHVFLVPNAIRLDQYAPGPKRPELLMRYGLDGKRVLMSLGRLAAAQRHKGVDEVIGVMPRLLDAFPDLVYVVVGGGDDIGRLREKAALLGLGERVVFTGFVGEAEKADHYRLADAFALAGHGDGFGFVLLEAMACGIPAVASRLDGSQEALRHGQLGTVVDPNDPDELAAGLAHALRQPKCVPDGLEYFAYPRFCERLRSVLRPVLACAT